MKPIALLAVFSIGWAAGAAGAQQEAALTTTEDFRRGNNEGLTRAADDRLARQPISGGSIGSWSTTAALPASRLLHGSTSYNGFAYVIGGANSSGNDTTTVYYSAVSSNGALSAWTATSALPSARSTVGAVAYNGFLYVIGGSASGVFSDVLFAGINANGTVGAWNSTTALPSGRAAVAVAAYNNFLYVLGGSPNAQSGLTDVYVAPIRANGTIGSWVSTTDLPSARYALTAAAYGDCLYAIAGTPSPQSGLREVLYAPINEDGTIGEWTETSSLSSGRYFHSSAVYDGHLYVLGGLTNGYFSDVLVAPITADGSLGSWTTTTSLPAVRAAHTSVLVDGFVYAIGGFSGGYLTSVIVAAIAEDDAGVNQDITRLVGSYSYLFDVQADSSTLSILLNGFWTRGANVRLEVRVAPSSTAVFGSKIVLDPPTSGTPIQLIPAGRWVWIRVILDDRESTDPDQPSHLSDLAVSPFPAPLPPLPVPPPQPVLPPTPDAFVKPPNVMPDDPESKANILPCSAGTQSSTPVLVLIAGIVVLGMAVGRRLGREFSFSRSGTSSASPSHPPGRAWPASARPRPTTS